MGTKPVKPTEPGLDQDFFRLLHLEARPSLPLPGREYESSFWRPYLGGVTFALWQVLRGYQPEARTNDGRWPTISVISQTLGIGDRATILGREATATRPAQDGELVRLRDNGLVIYSTAGEGKGQRYWFAVVERLPMLSPTQAKQLPSVLRRRHEKWVAGLGLMENWTAVTDPTLIRPFGG